MSDENRTTEPSDRLTRLCDAMTAALDAHPERGDEKCIVFLQSESDQRGGLQLHGYDDTEAMADLFMHRARDLPRQRQRTRVRADARSRLNAP